MVTLAENRHPIFRVTSPVSRSQLKNKSGGKLSIHYCAEHDTITTVFRTITSVNQLSLYEAIAEMCEEYESFHGRTRTPVVGRQASSSFVSSVIKKNVPLNNDDHAHIDLISQRYRERIEKLPQQHRMRKFCTDARFLTTIEIGQYFMTKDTEEFSQFTDSMACREYTLPRDENLSEPKGWIRGNTKIRPVLDVTTCCLQNKYGVEIRIKSVNKDNSHSRVRISHGYELEQQGPRWQRARKLRNAVRRICVKIECKWFCKPIKIQSKTTKTRFCHLIHKNYASWRQNLDRYSTKRIFNLRLWSVEEIDSSWKSTQRRRWSDWILENQRQSIYIPSSIQDWYRDVKIWATDRLCSFCLWIPWTKP